MDCIIKVGMLLSYDYEFLKTSLPCIYKHADQITLAMDDYQRTWSGNSFIIDSSFFDWLANFDIDNKIAIYRDNFYKPELSPSQNDTRERNMLAEFMGFGGWHVQIDADEYFIDFSSFANFLKEQSHYLNNPQENPITFVANLITLYKQTQEGFLYIDGGYESVHIATNMPRYEYIRHTNQDYKYSNFFLFHQSWARSEEEIYFKLKNWGHTNDFDIETYFEKWKDINENNYVNIRNFHPLSSSIWKELSYCKGLNVEQFIENFLEQQKPTLPLVSIGLPNYNGEKYLHQAITSILNQDYLNIELIIADDASTDSAAQICMSYAEKDSRIRYFSHKENKGTAFNFNFVLSQAQGEFFTWAANDDWIAPSYIRQCLKALEPYPNVIGCCSEINFINEDGSIRQHGWTGQYSNIDSLGKNVVERVREITVKLGWFAIYAVFRTNLIREIFNFQKRYADDVLQLVELAIKGEIVKIPEKLFNYRLPDIDKTPEDYARAFGLSKQQSDEVLNSSHTYTFKEILRTIHNSNLSIYDKYRIKQDTIHTLITRNHYWLSKIADENNFHLDSMTNFEIEKCLEDVIVPNEMKDSFDKNSVEFMSRVLIFFPHNPYPFRTGAHRRCLEIIGALKALGCEVILFSSNLFTDQPWHQSSIDYLNAQLGVKTYIYQGTSEDLNYFQVQRQLSKAGKTNWDLLVPPGMRQSFQEIGNQFKPNMVLVHYSFWGKLVAGAGFENCLRIIDTIDLYTLNTKMQQCLTPYIQTNVGKINPYTLDHRILNENFFKDQNLEPEPEEYQICDLFNYTIAISKLECELIKTNTHSTTVLNIPMSVDLKIVENSYMGEAIYVGNGNVYNLQGYFFFVRCVLPHLHHALSNFKLDVVGEIGDRVAPVEGINIHGFVEDLSELYKSSCFAICPLIGGTGQQVKIVEAMSFGLPVIALKNVGISSPIEHGVDGFIAETALEFSEYCRLLYTDRDLCRRMGQAARSKIDGNFSRKTASRLLQPVVDQSKNYLFKRPSPQIIIDAVFFQFYQTGIGRVWISILNQWVKTGLANHIVLLDRQGTAPKIPGILYRGLPIYNSASPEQERALLQEICDEEQADLFISSYYTVPETTPSIFVAYDMIPEAIGNMNLIMMREKHYAIQQAQSFVSISENTAKDLRKFFPDVSDKSITVAHCGISADFVSATPSDIFSFKHKYGIRKPYFLMVGSAFSQANNYKNGELFFKAFAALENHESFDILCTGGTSLDPYFRQYTSGSTVHMLRLPDEELRLAYAGAIALVFPSLYEGFGMPIIEAMACGCPVITCANSSIPEVAGEAALYVNETDPAEMAEALSKVQQITVREELIQAGLLRSQKYTWESMAEKVGNTLLKATLAQLNLKEINYIVCPDWSQPEELIAAELEDALGKVASSLDKEKTTLLIALEGSDAETADLIVSSAAMSLLMTSDLDISDGLEISFFEQLSNVQWQALLPMLNHRLPLEHENQLLVTTWLNQIPVL
jgi:glycosyltransferase involved in cell wall biosynthesis